MNVMQALISLRPGAKFVLYNNDYDTIEWMDNTSKPSKPEVEAEIARLNGVYDSNEYQRKRKPEYPPLTDLADAMYWASQGDNTKLDNYYAACEAVKLKYPKS